MLGFELGDRASLTRRTELALEIAQRPVAVGQTPQGASGVPRAASLFVPLRRPSVKLDGRIVVTCEEGGPTLQPNGLRRDLHVPRLLCSCLDLLPQGARGRKVVALRRTASQLEKDVDPFPANCLTEFGPEVLLRPLLQLLHASPVLSPPR